MSFLSRSRHALTRLRGFIQPPTADVSRLLLVHPPLLQSVPPANLRHAPLLALVGGTFLVGACDVVLNYWSRLERPPAAAAAESTENLVALDGAPAPAPTEAQKEEKEEKEEKWALRPQWQRASLCGVYITLSLALGLKLFATRARQIHRLHFLAPSPSPSPSPSSSSSSSSASSSSAAASASASASASGSAAPGRVKARTLMFQTCASGALRGHTAPLAHCTMLLDAGDGARVYLRVRAPAHARAGGNGAGGKGKGKGKGNGTGEVAGCGSGAGTFILGTAGARVGGKDVAPAKVFEALAKAGVPYERLEMRPKKK